MAYSQTNEVEASQVSRRLNFDDIEPTTGIPSSTGMPSFLKLNESEQCADPGTPMTTQTRNFADAFDTPSSTMPSFNSNKAPDLGISKNQLE